MNKKHVKTNYIDGVGASILFRAVSLLLNILSIDIPAGKTPTIE